MGFDSCDEWYLLNIDYISGIFLDVEITPGGISYHHIMVTLFLLFSATYSTEAIDLCSGWQTGYAVDTK